jgi:hypothetical protein
MAINGLVDLRILTKASGIGFIFILLSSYNSTSEKEGRENPVRTIYRFKSFFLWTVASVLTGDWLPLYMKPNYPPYLITPRPLKNKLSSASPILMKGKDDTVCIPFIYHPAKQLNQPLRRPTHGVADARTACSTASTICTSGDDLSRIISKDPSSNFVALNPDTS